MPRRKNRMNATSSQKRRIATSFADQVASSGSNFLFVFLLAQGAKPADLGIALLAYGVLTMAIVLSRATYGAIIGMDHHNLGPNARNVLFARSLAGAIALSAVPAVGLLTWAVVLGSDSAVAPAVAILGLATPVILVQDLLRYIAIASGHPIHALISDSLWLMTCAIAFLASLLGAGVASPTLGAGIWAAGSAIAGAVIVVSLRPPAPKWRGTGAWLLSDPRRAHMAADAAIGGTAPLVGSSLAGVWVGTQVVSAVRGAGALFGPLNIISASISTSLVPEAKRVAPAQANRLFRTATVVSLGMALSWGIALHLLPDSIGHALLGESWSLVETVLWATTVEYCGLALWATSMTRLRFFNLTALALRLRIIHAAMTALLPALCAFWFDSAVAFSWTLALIGVALGTSSAALVAAHADHSARGA